ncbi:MAG: folate-binding protein, partial [Pseudomonadota bacterium]
MTVFIAGLPDRAVIEIKGEDTLPFLQDLVTANVADLSPGQAVHSALLTPQGKILFDFFIVAIDGGVLLDCAAENAAALVQRLIMYRLRRALSIDQVDDLAVAAGWGEADLSSLSDGHVFPDPRNTGLGSRVIAPKTVIASLSGQPPETYQDHRYKLGIGDAAEIGSGDLFPHEACYDQFSSVD